jgi:hypothetical protein
MRVFCLVVWNHGHKERPKASRASAFSIGPDAEKIGRSTSGESASYLINTFQSHQAGLYRIFSVRICPQERRQSRVIELFVGRCS